MAHRTVYTAFPQSARLTINSSTDLLCPWAAQENVVKEFEIGTWNRMFVRIYHRNVLANKLVTRCCVTDA